MLRNNSGINSILYLLLGLFLFPGLVLNAQSIEITSQSVQVPSYGFEVKSSYGFIISHRPALRPLQDGHTRSIELSWISTSKGKKSWEENFLFPDRGINLAFFDLGSPDQLGTGIALYPFIDFPLHNADKLQFHFRYGMGLGYIEKIFDPENNQKNAAISSHMNGVIHFDLRVKKALGKRSAFDLGSGITHFSNGSTGIPNLGINIATVHAGFTSYFGQSERNTGSHTSMNPQFPLTAYVSGSLKKIYPPEGEQYQAATLAALYLKPISEKTCWGIGADIFYDNSIEEKFIREGDPKASASANFRPGIHAAWQIRTGALGLMFNMGVYPYTQWKGDGNFYHRICMRYYMERLFFCMNLKTHYARADFIEWGIGYGFGNKKSRQAVN